MASVDTRNGGLAARFMRWWTGELAALLPGALAHRLPGSAGRLMLDLSGPAWVLLRQRGGRDGRYVPIAEAEGGAARLRALGMTGRRVELLVSAQTLLVWRLSLPMAAGADLRGAIEFQAERKTPFGPGETYIGYRVLRRDAETRQIEVEVALVPRAAADGLGARAAALGLVATALSSDTVGALAPRIALPVAPRARSRWRGVLWLLAISAVLLVGAIVQTALAERTRIERHLAAELQAARAAAERVQREREAQARLQSARDVLLARRRETPSVVLTLDRLTRLLPDDVWLTQLSLSGGNAQAAGHAPVASALIGLIDAAEPFSAPRFLAAITRDTTIGLERFNLAFTVGDAP